MQETETAAVWEPRRASVAAWVLYDLANTTFALGVGSRYFGLWLIEDRGGADWQLSVTTIVAMLAVIILGPWIGALTDHLGRRVPYLMGSTLICVTATAFLATWGVVPSLVFYAIGTVGFHTGAVVYDALLPDVSTPNTRGRISGLGVAIGYAGSALALGIGAYLLPRDGYAAVFRGLAVAFLVFAIPAFVWIQERPRPRQAGRAPSLLAAPRTMVDAWRAAARVCRQGGVSGGHGIVPGRHPHRVPRHSNLGQHLPCVALALRPALRLSIAPILATAGGHIVTPACCVHPTASNDRASRRRPTGSHRVRSECQASGVIHGSDSSA